LSYHTIQNEKSIADLKENQRSLSQKVAEDTLARETLAAAEHLKSMELQKKQEAEAEAKKKLEEAEAKKKLEEEKAEQKRQENKQEEEKLEQKVDGPVTATALLEDLPPLLYTGRKGNPLRTPDFYYFDEV
jgi:uncharacterized protein YqfA (UPF0365 family)